MEVCCNWLTVLLIETYCKLRQPLYGINKRKCYNTTAFFKKLFAEVVTFMPLFDYFCEKCGENFEVYKKSVQDEQEICKRCGAPAKRRFAPVGIIFKGSGFYKTDSRADSSASKSTETKSSSDSSEKESKSA